MHDKGDSVHAQPVPENAVAVNPAGSVSLTVTVPAVGTRSDVRRGQGVRRSGLPLGERSGMRLRQRQVREGRSDDRRERLVGRIADVAPRVLSRHPVVVGARARRRVGGARRGRLPDLVPGSGREARRRRAMDVVPRHADVVGRSEPASG